MSSEFDIMAAPLAGVLLIDASAGTGKTYTISALVVRLLLEKGLGIDAILVVTYTEAAVDDLKTRVRQKIIEAIAAFRDGSSDDAFLAALLVRVTEPLPALRCLTTALRNFDEAAIFTIHGFCRRALTEHSLESGVLFDSELLVDQHDLLQEIAEDFFRLNFYGASPLLAAACFKEFAPPSLLKKLGNIHAREDVRIIPVIDGGRCLRELAGGELEYRRLFQAFTGLWPSKREVVAEILLTSGALNRNKYRLTSIPGWLRAMDRLAALAEPPVELFAEFARFTPAVLAQAGKAGQAIPADEFFDLCGKLHTAGAELAAVLAEYRCYLEAEFFSFVKLELKSRKEAAGSYSFDDLLSDLHQALNGEHGLALARLLNTKYQAAMIDEFQDTDPVQYEIFSRIFKGPGALLYLIGDPKQAIYSFRGADIFAYIRAVREVGQRYTLGENWRSVPGLVAAVNAIFNTGARPFIFEEIVFDQARAADKPQQLLTIDHDAPAPFQFWAFEGEPDRDCGKLLNKDDARQLVLARQTAEVVRLLNLGAAGRATLGNRPLTAGDLAILVRTNHEARLVQESLAGAGITSAINSSESLFASREAAELRIVLLAMLEAGDSRRIRAALATRLLGGEGGRLDLFAGADDFLVEWLGKFRKYQELWAASGFAAMFSHFLETEGVRARLLLLPAGERSLTNVLHLLEVLHLAGEEHLLGMTGLVKYLAGRVAVTDGPTAEAQQLRLESDADLVQIVTIHKAKGLQYPVVFCPFCWEGSRLTEKRKKSQGYLFHDPADGELKLDIGSPEVDANRRHAIREELAENLRLLYVALTRAVQCCYLAWGPFSGSGTSALAYLLHGGSAGGDDREGAGAVDYLGKRSGADLAADLDRLVEGAAGQIRLNFVEAGAAPAGLEMAGGPGPLSCRKFGGSPATTWRISSFSALSRRLQAPYLPGLEDQEAGAGGRPAPSYADIIDFPRGAGPGTFLHALLEDLDFRANDRAGRCSFLRERLAAGGYDPAWAPALSDLIANLLNTPLDPAQPDLMLAKVGKSARLNELEFYFPVTDFNPAGLGGLLGDRLISVWPADKIRGFMKGFIDLVFCHDEKFYIVDWKSNFLGREISDYRPEDLRRVMDREHYYLQYLIYTIAVHRYLLVRMPGYSYEENFGGVFYIFLRGLGHGAGADSGIYRAKPSYALIRNLSALLGE